MAPLLLLSLLFGASASSPAAAAAHGELPWAAAMERDGYVVQEGVYDWFTTKTCAHTDTCYCINPVTPYGLMWLPPHPNESATAEAYTNRCHVHGICKSVGNATWAPLWRVGPGETIVVVGRTPPNATYWSFDNYLYTRFHQPGYRSHPKNIHQRLVSCPSVPRHGPGERCEIFAGINDPLNMATVNASSPFDAPFAMVLSWDAASEAATTSYLDEHLRGGEMTNTHRFPGSVLNLGVTRGDEDEFVNVFRLEGVKDPAASKKFYSSPPLRVFRVSPTSTVPAPPPSALWASFDGKMRTRWTGRSEAAPGVSTEALRDGLAELEHLVRKNNSRSPFDHAAVQFTSYVNDSGYECIAAGTKCMGDDRDSIYARATFVIREELCNKTHLPCRKAGRSELTGDPRDALYVIGVNHEQLNHVLYSSITMYDFPKLASALLIPQGRKKGQYTLMDKDYRGTARRYLPGHVAADYLYVVKYARKCLPDDFDFCVEVPSHSANPDDITMGLDSKLLFMERSYVRPGTKSGPAISETILPKLLHFRRFFGAEEEVFV